MKLPKTFLGYTNIKFLIKEFIKLYSSQPSFFSKKRFESGMAFFAGIGIMLCYIWSHRHSMINYEMLADVTILFGVAGYSVKKIQEEKLNNCDNKKDESTT